MTTYDEIPYPVYSHATTHPAGMATLAALHGLSAPPVERCRVLELGCASGGNLIPMALGLPDSEFVGVDNSARQLATGRAYADALDLRNLSLRHLDVQDVGDDLGQFDYIIAHGLYSWVSADRQEKILEICRRNLSPEGVAFVSYNTLPGWRTLSVIRDMLLYHTRATGDPRTQTARARSLLNFLAKTTGQKRSATGGLVQAYADFFKAELDSLGAAHDSYLLHEMLEEVNEPIYFSEFISRATRHGLGYLSEVEFRLTLERNLDATLAQGVRNMARDEFEWEQYVDFVKGRTFRQTLLVHQGRPVSREMKTEALAGFYIASGARPVGVVDSNPVAVQDFGDPETLALSTDHPVTKAVMSYLGEIWPQFVSFEAALAEGRRRLGLTGYSPERAALDARILADNLLTAYTYSSKLVELSTYAPPFTIKLSERPLASPWARLQVLDAFIATNLRHERVELNAVQAYVLRYLDGTRDRAAVLEAMMVGPVAGGKMTIKQHEVPVTDPAQVRAILAPEIDQALEQLARLAMLVG